MRTSESASGTVMLMMMMTTTSSPPSVISTASLTVHRDALTAPVRARAAAILPEGTSYPRSRSSGMGGVGVALAIVVGLVSSFVQSLGTSGSALPYT